MSQPFSGIFGTYLLPNNHYEPEITAETVIGSYQTGIFFDIFKKCPNIF
jgi:hypothetical protein